MELMAGHSKWAQIKRQKGVADAARSKVFSRFARLITMESKRANGDQSAPALASAIERAKAANMPKDNIARAVAKGTSKDAGDLASVLYEFYGPGGTAILVDALTDNTNRTTQEIKHLLSKNGYALGGPGSAAWAFSKAPGGAYVPNEPLAELAPRDEDALGLLFEALDAHDDVQRTFTNARGYEASDAE